MSLPRAIGPGRDLFQISLELHQPVQLLQAQRRSRGGILGPGAPDMSQRGVAVSEDQIRALIPAGARGEVDDIASAVCYLASDEAGYVNGHTLTVDGGFATAGLIFEPEAGG